MSSREERGKGVGGYLGQGRGRGLERMGGDNEKTGWFQCQKLVFYIEVS